MTDTSKADPPPHTNGIDNDADEDERGKLRPADIDADVREMERRKRVEMIMNSRLFREELERIIEIQMKDGGNGPAGLLQQISDIMGGRIHPTGMFKSSNCVVPINDIRGVESMGYAKGEKLLRCKLAAVYRLIDLYGWAQGINNLITARLNQEEELFLANPHGMLYHELTASSLVKLDMQGNVVESGTTNFPVNNEAFQLHAAVHAARPDIKCVIHVHTPSLLAVSSCLSGILPISQEAISIGEVSYHPFFLSVDADEKEQIGRSLGPINKVLFIANKGALCCGETVEEAFFNVYNTIVASETQLKLGPTVSIDNVRVIPEEARKPGSNKSAALQFEALMRMLDNAGFRTGYIYRQPLVKGELPRPRNDVEVPPAVSSLGYLLEEEEMYKQGQWKRYADGRKSHDRTRWLNSPNVYQKVEILETGTPDPKKITKWVDANAEEWVVDGSPTHSSTPVKIESALQFVPKNTNPREFKSLQKQIKENRRADKITSGPQSHILEGVSWEEAKQLQDAKASETGEQVIVVGAASKGIIQREFQHHATVYKTPYAKNPFDTITDQELEDYRKVVTRKQKGEYSYDDSESEGFSSSAALPPSGRGFVSETEDESRGEARVLRIETKQVPRASKAEVVLSDALTPAPSNSDGGFSVSANSQPKDTEKESTCSSDVVKVFYTRAKSSSTIVSLPSGADVTNSSLKDNFHKIHVELSERLLKGFPNLGSGSLLPKSSRLVKKCRDNLNKLVGARFSEDSDSLSKYTSEFDLTQVGSSAGFQKDSLDLTDVQGVSSSCALKDSLDDAPQITSSSSVESLPVDIESEEINTDISTFIAYRGTVVDLNSSHTSSCPDKSSDNETVLEDGDNSDSMFESNCPLCNKWCDHPKLGLSPCTSNESQKTCKLTEEDFEVEFNVDGVDSYKTSPAESEEEDNSYQNYDIFECEPDFPVIKAKCTNIQPVQPAVVVSATKLPKLSTITEESHLEDDKNHDQKSPGKGRTYYASLSENSDGTANEAEISGDSKLKSSSGSDDSPLCDDFYPFSDGSEPCMKSKALFQKGKKHFKMSSTDSSDNDCDCNQRSGVSRRNSCPSNRCDYLIENNELRETVSDLVLLKQEESLDGVVCDSHSMTADCESFEFINDETVLTNKPSLSFSEENFSEEALNDFQEKFGLPRSDSSEGAYCRVPGGEENPQKQDESTSIEVIFPPNICADSSSIQVIFEQNESEIQPLDKHTIGEVESYSSSKSSASSDPEIGPSIDHDICCNFKFSRRCTCVRSESEVENISSDENTGHYKPAQLTTSEESYACGSHEESNNVFSTCSVSTGVTDDSPYEQVTFTATKAKSHKDNQETCQFLSDSDSFSDPQEIPIGESLKSSSLEVIYEPAENKNQPADESGTVKVDNYRSVKSEVSSCFEGSVKAPVSISAHSNSEDSFDRCVRINSKSESETSSFEELGSGLNVLFHSSNSCDDLSPFGSDGKTNKDSQNFTPLSSRSESANGSCPSPPHSNVDHSSCDQASFSDDLNRVPNEESLSEDDGVLLPSDPATTLEDEKPSLLGNAHVDDVKQIPSGDTVQPLFNDIQVQKFAEEIPENNPDLIKSDLKLKGTVDGTGNLGTTNVTSTLAMTPSDFLANEEQCLEGGNLSASTSCTDKDQYQTIFFNPDFGQEVCHSSDGVCEKPMRASLSAGDSLENDASNASMCLRNVNNTAENFTSNAENFTSNADNSTSTSSSVKYDSFISNMDKNLLTSATNDTSFLLEEVSVKKTSTPVSVGSSLKSGEKKTGVSEDNPIVSGEEPMFSVESDLHNSTPPSSFQPNEDKYSGVNEDNPDVSVEDPRHSVDGDLSSCIPPSSFQPSEDINSGVSEDNPNESGEERRYSVDSDSPSCIPPSSFERSEDKNSEVDVDNSNFSGEDPKNSLDNDSPSSIPPSSAEPRPCVPSLQIAVSETTGGEADFTDNNHKQIPDKNASAVNSKDEFSLESKTQVVNDQELNLEAVSSFECDLEFPSKFEPPVDGHLKVNLESNPTVDSSIEATFEIPTAVDSNQELGPEPVSSTDRLPVSNEELTPDTDIVAAEGSVVTSKPLSNDDLHASGDVISEVTLEPKTSAHRVDEVTLEAKSDNDDHEFTPETESCVDSNQELLLESRRPDCSHQETSLETSSVENEHEFDLEAMSSEESSRYPTLESKPPVDCHASTLEATVEGVTELTLEIPSAVDSNSELITDSKPSLDSNRECLISTASEGSSHEHCNELLTSSNDPSVSNGDQVLPPNPGLVVAEVTEVTSDLRSPCGSEESPDDQTELLFKTCAEFSPERQVCETLSSPTETDEVSEVAEKLTEEASSLFTNPQVEENVTEVGISGASEMHEAVEVSEVAEKPTVESSLFATLPVEKNVTEVGTLGANEMHQAVAVSEVAEKLTEESLSLFATLPFEKNMTEVGISGASEMLEAVEVSEVAEKLTVESSLFATLPVEKNVTEVGISGASEMHEAVEVSEVAEKLTVESSLFATLPVEKNVTEVGISGASEVHEVVICDENSERETNTEDSYDFRSENCLSHDSHPEDKPTDAPAHFDGEIFGGYLLRKSHSLNRIDPTSDGPETSELDTESTEPSVSHSEMGIEQPATSDQLMEDQCSPTSQSVELLVGDLPEEPKSDDRCEDVFDDKQAPTHHEDLPSPISESATRFDEVLDSSESMKSSEPLASSASSSKSASDQHEDFRVNSNKLSSDPEDEGNEPETSAVQASSLEPSDDVIVETLEKSPEECGSDVLSAEKNTDDTPSEEVEPCLDNLVEEQDLDSSNSQPYEIDNSDPADSAPLAEDSGNDSEFLEENSQEVPSDVLTEELTQSESPFQNLEGPLASGSIEEETHLDLLNAEGHDPSIHEDDSSMEEGKEDVKNTEENSNEMSLDQTLEQNLQSATYPESELPSKSGEPIEEQSSDADIGSNYSSALGLREKTFVILKDTNVELPVLDESQEKLKDLNLSAPKLSEEDGGVVPQTHFNFTRNAVNERTFVSGGPGESVVSDVPENLSGGEQPISSERFDEGNNQSSASDFMPGSANSISATGLAHSASEMSANEITEKTAEEESGPNPSFSNLKAFWSGNHPKTQTETNSKSDNVISSFQAANAGPLRDNTSEDSVRITSPGSTTNLVSSLSNTQTSINDELSGHSYDETFNSSEQTVDSNYQTCEDASVPDVPPASIAVDANCPIRTGSCDSNGAVGLDSAETREGEAKGPHLRAVSDAEEDATSEDETKSQGNEQEVESVSTDNKVVLPSFFEEQDTSRNIDLTETGDREAEKPRLRPISNAEAEYTKLQAEVKSQEFEKEVESVPAGNTMVLPGLFGTQARNNDAFSVAKNEIECKPQESPNLDQLPLPQHKETAIISDSEEESDLNSLCNERSESGLAGQKKDQHEETESVSDLEEEIDLNSLFNERPKSGLAGQKKDQHEETESVSVLEEEVDLNSLFNERPESGLAGPKNNSENYTPEDEDTEVLSDKEDTVFGQTDSEVGEEARPITQVTDQLTEEGGRLSPLGKCEPGLGSESHDSAILCAAKETDCSAGLNSGVALIKTENGFVVESVPVTDPEPDLKPVTECISEVLELIRDISSDNEVESIDSQEVVNTTNMIINADLGDNSRCLSVEDISSENETTYSPENFSACLTQLYAGETSDSDLTEVAENSAPPENDLNSLNTCDLAQSVHSAAPNSNIILQSGDGNPTATEMDVSLPVMDTVPEVSRTSLRTITCNVEVFNFPDTAETFKEALDDQMEVDDPEVLVAESFQTDFGGGDNFAQCCNVSITVESVPDPHKDESTGLDHAQSEDITSDDGIGTNMQTYDTSCAVTVDFDHSLTEPFDLSDSLENSLENSGLVVDSIDNSLNNSVGYLTESDVEILHELTDFDSIEPRRKGLSVYPVYTHVKLSTPLKSSSESVKKANPPRFLVSKKHSKIRLQRKFHPSSSSGKSQKIDRDKTNIDTLFSKDSEKTKPVKCSVSFRPSVLIAERSDESSTVTVDISNSSLSGGSPPEDDSDSLQSRQSKKSVNIDDKVILSGLNPEIVPVQFRPKAGSVKKARPKEHKSAAFSIEVDRNSNIVDPKPAGRSDSSDGKWQRFCYNMKRKQPQTTGHRLKSEPFYSIKEVARSRDLSSGYRKSHRAGMSIQPQDVGLPESKSASQKISSRDLDLVSEPDLVPSETEQLVADEGGIVSDQQPPLNTEHCDIRINTQIKIRQNLDDSFKLDFRHNLCSADGKPDIQVKHLKSAEKLSFSEPSGSSFGTEMNSGDCEKRDLPLKRQQVARSKSGSRKETSGDSGISSEVAKVQNVKSAKEGRKSPKSREVKQGSKGKTSEASKSKNVPAAKALKSGEDRRQSFPPVIETYFNPVIVGEPSSSPMQKSHPREKEQRKMQARRMTAGKKTETGTGSDSSSATENASQCPSETEYSLQFQVSKQKSSKVGSITSNFFGKVAKFCPEVKYNSDSEPESGYSRSEKQHFKAGGSILDEDEQSECASSEEVLENLASFSDDVESYASVEGASVYSNFSEVWDTAPTSVAEDENDVTLTNLEETQQTTNEPPEIVASFDGETPVNVVPSCSAESQVVSGDSEHTILTVDLMETEEQPVEESQSSDGGIEFFDRKRRALRSREPVKLSSSLEEYRELEMNCVLSSVVDPLKKFGTQD